MLGLMGVAENFYSAPTIHFSNNSLNENMQKVSFPGKRFLGLCSYASAAAAKFLYFVNAPHCRYKSCKYFELYSSE